MNDHVQVNFKVIFKVILFLFRDSKKIISNKYVGHMLRSKLSDSDEGGVAAGYGALDSVLLVDTKRCCTVAGGCADKSQQSCTDRVL